MNIESHLNEQSDSDIVTYVDQINEHYDSDSDSDSMWQY